MELNREKIAPQAIMEINQNTKLKQVDGPMNLVSFCRRSKSA